MYTIFDPIARPLGQFLYFIYNNLAFHRYGLAIIIFTIIIRLILLPLTIKQYRSMAKMQELQPKLQDLQRRYKNDKEKLNQEMMKLYRENNANPAGGCLPLLIQMPILISLYWAISRPLHYMLNKSNDVINQLLAALPQEVGRATATYGEIHIINYFQKNINELSKVSHLLKPEELINMNFFGLNLGLTPTWDLSRILSGPDAGQFLALLLIPLLAAATTYISSRVVSPQQSAQSAQAENAPGASMQKNMIIISTGMILFFSFTVPAGLGLYWITGNVIQILQQLYINKFIIKKKGGSQK